MNNKELMEQQLQEIEKTLPVRFPIVPLSGSAVSVEQWRETIRREFPELLLPAEIGASVLAQLLIKDITNPFGLVYVDAPSSGKTITLNFFSELPELVYATDNFTAASFVSQAANVKRTELSKVDLLPRIQYKTLIVRDLAPIFGGKDDDLQKSIGILTRVFDGEGLWLDGGVHGGRGYQGDYIFMFLGASTPISPRVWKLMGNFGSRLLFFGINSHEKDEDTLANQLKIRTVRKKEKICRSATKELVATIWSRHPQGVEWDRSNDPQELLKIVARTAKLLAKLRGTVNVWEERYGEERLNHTIPQTEMPDRLNQLLYNISRGHAIICGRNNLDSGDISVVLRVAFDSAPPVRTKLFKALLEAGGALSTSEVIAKLKCSSPTALYEMEKLGYLDIVDVDEDNNNYSGYGRPEKTMKLKEQFQWFLSNECKNLLC